MNRRKSLSIIVLSLLVVFAVVTTVTAAPVLIYNFEMEDREKDTRLIIEMSNEKRHNIFTVENPPRLVVDLAIDGKDAGWFAPSEDRAKYTSDHIDKVYFHKHDKTFRVVADLSESMKVRRAFYIPPNNINNSYRLIVDLQKPALFEAETRMAEAGVGRVPLKKRKPTPAEQFSSGLSKMTDLVVSGVTKPFGKKTMPPPPSKTYEPTTRKTYIPPPKPRDPRTLSRDDSTYEKYKAMVIENRMTSREYAIAKQAERDREAARTAAPTPRVKRAEIPAFTAPVPPPSRPAPRAVPERYAQPAPPPMRYADPGPAAPRYVPEYPQPPMPSYAQSYVPEQRPSTPSFSSTRPVVTPSKVFKYFKGSKATTVTTPQRKHLVILDPAHGGQDSGSIGRAGTLEKDVTLNYALALKHALEVTGRYNVLLLRDSDLFLTADERREIANQVDGDIYISLQADAYVDPRVRGISAYTLSKAPKVDKQLDVMVGFRGEKGEIRTVDLNGEDKKMVERLSDIIRSKVSGRSDSLADIMVTEFSRDFDLQHADHRYAGYNALIAADIPAVLLELGYLSNDIDERLLLNEDYRYDVIATIVRSFDIYFSQPKEEKSKKWSFY